MDGNPGGSEDLLYDGSLIPDLETVATMDMYQHPSHGRVLAIGLFSMGPDRVFLAKDFQNDGIVDEVETISSVDFEEQFYGQPGVEDFLNYD